MSNFGTFFTGNLEKIGKHEILHFMKGQLPTCAPTDVERKLHGKALSQKERKSKHYIVTFLDERKPPNPIMAATSGSMSASSSSATFSFCTQKKIWIDQQWTTDFHGKHGSVFTGENLLVKDKFKWKIYVSDIQIRNSASVFPTSKDCTCP